MKEFIVEWGDSFRSVCMPTFTGVVVDQTWVAMLSALRRAWVLDSPWDNYQCKHYAGSLAVADVVAEVGKLLYHASQGEFSLPMSTFSRPARPSTALLKVLQKGTLKQELLTRWKQGVSDTKSLKERTLSWLASKKH